MLPIHEQFYTFQGEGAHAGRAAYFIRTFGCPVHCPWCDSAGTWHPDYIPKKIAKVDEAELVAAVLKTKAELVVITGGEPAIHDLDKLCKLIRENGKRIHLETSGAFPIRGEFNWITLSPKRWKKPLLENAALANEFKVIVDAENAIEEYSDMLRGLGVGPEKSIWLHPEWSQRDNTTLLNQITDWVKTHGAPYRAGWQMHKNYAADLLDEHSAPAAPLGGDLGRGF
ncbi:MAG: 7-carboxy-7-deazaguanine synthase QueE [Lentimonas sp.]